MGDDRDEIFTGAERVLVVEDDEVVRMAATYMLASLGYEVLEAANADQALEVLDKEGPVDLLFTDIVMPGKMNGVRLAEKLQENLPSLKVLFATGYSPDEAGISTSDVPVLKKPYRKAQLAQTVREVLNGKS